MWRFCFLIGARDGEKICVVCDIPVRDHADARPTAQPGQHQHHASTPMLEDAQPGTERDLKIETDKVLTLLWSVSLVLLTQHIIK